MIKQLHHSDLKMELYMRKKSFLWISLIVFHVTEITRAGNGTDIELRLTATPSKQISTGEQLKIQCSTTTTPPPSCRFQWAHAYFSDRDGPIIQTINVLNQGHDSRYKIRVVSYCSSKSMLLIPYMRAPLQGIFHCALLCQENSTQEKRIVAESSVQIRVAEGNASVLVKKDLAMMMVSAVIIIFVLCMLLAGLILRVRQCYTRREFEREQERRQRLYDAESMIEEDSSKGVPPPTYSEVVQGEEFTNDNGSESRNNSCVNATNANNRRTLCSRQNSSDSTRALCPNDDTIHQNINENTATIQDSKSDITTSEDTKQCIRALCLRPELLESGTLRQEVDSSNSQDTLFTLMDQSDSAGSFDQGVLAFQPPPDYEDAVVEMEKQGIPSINRSALSPMPPAYSELSLHL